jgi:hypothetical protein
MSTNTTNLVHVGEKTGWQSQPNGRGTIDIIWSCLLTIFLCTWSVLSLNVPAQGTSTPAFILRKMKWMLIAGLGPEWVTGMAGAQWSIAGRSSKKFRAQNCKWTRKQAYFADMGGIRLTLRDDQFPITSEMLLKLVIKKIVKFPDMSKSMIQDRSKVDFIAKLITFFQTAWCAVRRRVRFHDSGKTVESPDTISESMINSKPVELPDAISESMINSKPVELPDMSESVIQDRSKVDFIAKLITFFQTAWFVIECAARRGQGLYITSLELSTVAFVVCTIGTMILWWSKPTDVMVPIIISVDMRLAELMDVLDLIDKEPPAPCVCSPLWKLDELRPSLHCDVLPQLQRVVFWKKNTALSEKQKQDEEKARFRNDRLPPAPRDWYLNHFLTTVSILFGAIYVAGWNISFPTTVESIFWRVAICSMLGGVLAFWVLDYGLVLYYTFRRQPVVSIGPFRIALCGIIATVYVCCRLFLIIEMFVSLRELPVSAYETVNWTLPMLHLS